jgi:hypothetical protein
MTPPTDLTLRPPRSPRIRLGGFAILARMLDKGRATIAGHQAQRMVRKMQLFSGFGRSLAFD